MPTKKQRRRAQKERRHEYETVWVDEEGNELDEPPEELVDTSARRDGAKPKPKAKAAPQRGARPLRVPPAPSWQRAARRSLILGVVIFAVVYLLGAKNGQHSVAAAFGFAGLYTLLFIPLGYMFDRFAHNRWQRRADQQQAKRAPRKR
jgi:hypothetical protein